MNVLRFSDLCAQGKAKGQRVFIRADLNVPQDDSGAITEDTRIRASVPCIQQALDAGAAVMVTSHLGRPTEGEMKPADSLAPVAQRLGELLGREVPLVANWVDGVQVATLYFVDDAQHAALAERDARVLRAGYAVVVIMAVGVGSVLAWVELRYLRPFRRMRRFAQDVAGGDLEAPLMMDRANAFGAFTESFDLMRVELAASRRREAEGKEARSVLVAQLNHDLRTPVATIAANAEVLRISEQDPRRGARLDTIVAKTEQIRELAEELSQASRLEQAVL